MIFGKNSKGAGRSLRIGRKINDLGRVVGKVQRVNIAEKKKKKK